MKKAIVKSIGAILAGWMLGAVLSVATDFLMDKLGIMSMENFSQSPPVIVLLVIVYRFIFNATGCYLTAKLAPSDPMKHVMVIGVLGTILAILGSMVMWDKAVAWYNISILLIALPSAWLGGKIYLSKTTS